MAGSRRIEDLMNVKGVGEKSFLKLKPLITGSGQTRRSTRARISRCGLVSDSHDSR